jgi:hypothetical protein
VPHCGHIFIIHLVPDYGDANRCFRRGDNEEHYRPNITVPLTRILLEAVLREVRTHGNSSMFVCK